MADSGQVELAIQAADSAAAGWARSSPQKRADILDFIGSEVLARRDEVATGDNIARMAVGRRAKVQLEMGVRTRCLCSMTPTFILPWTALSTARSTRQANAARLPAG